MTPSMPTTTAPGAEDDLISTLNVADIGDGARARFRLRDRAQYARIIVDGMPQGPALYCEIDQDCELRGVYESTGTGHVVSVGLQGDWPDDQVDITGQQILFQDGRSNRIHLDIEANPNVFAYGDSAQFASWTLEGLRRFQNVKPVELHPLWGRIDIALSTSGAVHTLTLSQDGVSIASGSITGDGQIGLSPLNGSGVSGSVTLTYTADFTGNAYLIAAWPKQYKIHYKLTPFTGGDFPRTAEATLYDDGHASLYTFRSAVLAAGTYYVVPHQVSENGVESTGIFGGGFPVQVYDLPAAPTALAYSSGGAAATIVSFTASTTASATYNFYDSGDTGIMPLDFPVATHIAGVGSLTQTLPAISGSFTGIRQVLARAALAGIEEANSEILEIEYAAGVVVALRPPVPGIIRPIGISGRTITVSVRIQTVETVATASTVELFLAAVPGDNSAPTFTYGTPSGTASAGNTVGNVMQPSVSATAGGDGQYYYTVRSKTAGGTQSDNTDYYGPVLLSTAVPTDPDIENIYAGN